MWMLITINVTVLAALVLTLWRLSGLQRRFLVHNRPDDPVVGRKIDTVDRRREHALPKRSGLDEFPEESSLKETRRHVPTVRTASDEAHRLPRRASK